MMTARVTEHPLCRVNTLRAPYRDDPGAYSYIVDAVVTASPPPTYFVARYEDKVRPLSLSADIARFEYCNRMFTHLHGTSFDIIRRLTGISHALLSVVGDLAWEHQIKVGGHQLEELQVSGGPPKTRSFITELLRRVGNIERTVDRIWHALEPVAELGSIDFSDRVPLFPLEAWETEVRRDRKAIKFLAMIERYSPAFGGYHERTSYESFQALMRHLWVEFHRIGDFETRKEILRLGMAVATLGETDDLVTRDPITTLLNNMAAAQQDGTAARRAFAQEGHRLHLEALRGVRALEDEALRDIDPKARDIHHFAPSLATHVDHQINWEHWLNGGVFPWDRRHLSYHESEYRPFFWFTVTQSATSSVEVNNPVFIDRVPRDEEGALLNPLLPATWWRQLIVLEAFRQALKSGRPLMCPFRGFQIRGESSPWHEDFPQTRTECSRFCLIGRWLERATQWSDLPTERATCPAYIPMYPKR